MKNATSILLCFVCGVRLLSCASSQDRPNVIASFENIQYDSALIGFIRESDREETLDTVLIKDGILRYSFKGSGLHEGIIIPFSLLHTAREGDKRPLPASRIRFFINPDETIELTVTIIDNCAVYTATGNELSAQIAEERKEKIEIFKDGMDVFYRYNSRPLTEESEKIYWQGRSKNDSLYLVHSIRFIDLHPDYEYSARLWIETTKNRETALRLFNKLDQKVKQTFFGQLATSIVNGWTMSVPGNELPNFTAKTIEGEYFELNAYRGKFVILDFWGTWCSPCIVEIPKLKVVREKWRDKLIIVALACNDRKESVEKAIDKYKIEWIQLFSDSNEFPFSFGIKEFPTKVLLDPNGKVVKLYDSSSDASLFVEIDSLIQTYKWIN